MTIRGRRDKYPFNPAMNRAPERRERIQPDAALLRLIRRLMQADVADAERLQFTADAIFKSHKEAVEAVRALDRLLASFANQVRHYKPIAQQLDAIADDPDEPPKNNAELVYRRLHELAMRRMSPQLIALLTERSTTCPLCQELRSPLTSHAEKSECN